MGLDFRYPCPRRRTEYCCLLVRPIPVDGACSILGLQVWVLVRSLAINHRAVEHDVVLIHGTDASTVRMECDQTHDRFLVHVRAELVQSVGGQEEDRSLAQRVHLGRRAGVGTTVDHEAHAGRGVGVHRLVDAVRHVQGIDDWVVGLDRATEDRVMAPVDILQASGLLDGALCDHCIEALALSDEHTSLRGHLESDVPVALEPLPRLNQHYVVIALDGHTALCAVVKVAEQAILVFDMHRVLVSAGVGHCIEAVALGPHAVIKEQPPIVGERE